MTKKDAIIACARWLQACLELGWDQSDLDFLERLWWQHHDEHGNLSPLLPLERRSHEW